MTYEELCELALALGLWLESLARAQAERCAPPTREPTP